MSWSEFVTTCELFDEIDYEGYGEDGDFRDLSASVLGLAGGAAA